jgi:hypothetical protein
MEPILANDPKIIHHYEIKIQKAAIAAQILCPVCFVPESSD